MNVKMFMMATALFSSSVLAVSELAKDTSDYALATYSQPMLDSLEKLVAYNTVAVEGVPADQNPVHIEFKQELKRQALALGLDYQDFGYVVIVGLGKSEERLGVITHGDVQPADPSKWQQSPYKLDKTSKPGKLIGRGTEDDKGPISTALYAMKAIKDQGIKLKRRIELYVYMAEESDWEPLKLFVKQHKMPQLNITIDASYPVVVAEKGYGTLSMTFPHKQLKTDKPYLQSFSGGFFGSQIPEDAQAIIANASPNLLATLKQKAKSHGAMQYEFKLEDDNLSITAKGVSAHSSEPEDGVNAITYLADLLALNRWPNNAAGALVNFLNDHIGIGLYGKKFGDMAYKDDFMGPMTVSPTVLKQLDPGIELNINIRRPKGKTSAQLHQEFQQVIKVWQQQNRLQLLDVKAKIKDPFVQTGAPHIPTLLDVFSFYTGIQDPQPLSIGGGTNSRLFPYAVSFGPSMPGKKYTGHSEHEFITLEQFHLNLQMYTSVLVELAAQQ